MLVEGTTTKDYIPYYTAIDQIARENVSDTMQNVDGITLEARNIHPTYYGNIDACDTPEGGNVGVINHLTIDALIGNSRGSFGVAEKGDDRGTGALSACVASVPYVNHDDGCRVMFSCSQGKQYVMTTGEGDVPDNQL